MATDLFSDPSTIRPLGLPHFSILRGHIVLARMLLEKEFEQIHPSSCAYIHELSRQHMVEGAACYCELPTGTHMFHPPKMHSPHESEIENAGR